MWVVFRKSDKRVIGTSGHGSIELSKDQAIEEIVKGSLEGGDPKDFDAVQVRDPQRVRELQGQDRRRPGRPPVAVIETQADGTLRPVVQEQETFSLALATDATAFHPVDNVAIIPADGRSAVEVSIQKVDEQNQPVARARDNDELWLRTDHGTILNRSGNSISKLRLSRGEAAFRLQSGTSPRLATVRVFNADPDLQDAFLQVEFIPPAAAPPAAGRRRPDDKPFTDKLGGPIEELAVPDDFQQDLRRALDILRGFGSGEVYLLGAAAAGEAGADAAVDLAIRGHATGKLAEIRTQLADALERPVDVVDLDGSTAFARHLRSIEGELLRIG